MIRFLALMLCLLAGPVMAGAWLRDPGTGYASLSHWGGQGGADSYTALFSEWGLTPRLTLGLDAGRSVSGQSKAVIFLRTPLMVRTHDRLAGEIGWGEIAGRSVIRPGLSYGRGLTSPYGAGWLAVDTVLELDIETRGMDLKADVTLGLSPHPAQGPPSPWTLMMQLQTGLVTVNDSLVQLLYEGVRPDPSFLRLAPSATYRLRDGLDLELGFYRSIAGSTEKGVKIGIWSRF